MTKLDRMVKSAAATGQSSLAQRMLFPLSAAALTLGIAYGIVPAINKRRLKKSRDETWAKIRKTDPELAGAEGVRSQFEAIHDLSPKVMGHPTFAIPVLRQSADYGTKGVPLQLLQMASSIEHGSGGLASSGRTTAALPTTVADLAGRMVR